MQTIRIALTGGRQLPLFWPGAVVALVPCDTSPRQTPPAARTNAVRRRAAGHPRRPRSPAYRGSIAIGHIDCGPDRIQLRLIRRRGAGGANGLAQCRLTGFIQAPDIVNRRARSVTRRELRAARQALTQGTPHRQLTRELRVHLLLSLQARRSLPAAVRRHPELERVWREVVRHEHRRMLKRLRHAVRRLRRALDANPRT